MKKVLFILFSLLYSVAFAQRATVTILQPRMYNVTNTLSQCNAKTADQLDNCPGGSTCVEDAGTPGKGRCTLFTSAENQKSGGFDYEATRVLSMETQIKVDAASSPMDCDLSHISSVTNDGEKWRCLEHAVHLFLGDNEAISDYESSCTVTFHGDIGTKIQQGTLSTVGMDGAVLSSGFANNTADKKISCHYVPRNMKYLGNAFVSVTFNKTSNLRLGEVGAKIIKVPLKFVPGDRAVAGDVDQNSDGNYYSEPTLKAAHDLLSAPADEDGIYQLVTDKGTLKLSYRLNVMDKRYLILGQSGVETLPREAGAFTIEKEGLVVSDAYDNFFSGTNEFVQSGVNALRKDHKDYEEDGCAESGDDANDSMALCSSDSDYYNRDYAQYQLTGVYEAIYAGMPHLKHEYYNSCEICNDRLSFKGYMTQGNGNNVEMHVAIDVQKTTIESGCVGNRTAGKFCVYLPNIAADPVNSGSGVRDGSMLRLPGAYPLGDFIVPKLQGELGYVDLDDSFDFLGTSRLQVSSVGNDNGLSIGDACVNQGAGKARDMAVDMQSFMENLFFNECEITVESGVHFGLKSSVIFFESADAGASNITTDIITVDGRRIFVGDTELSLLRRKLASVELAGASITLSISKVTNTPTQVLSYDILGTNTMMGYDNNGAKCTTASQPFCNNEAAVDSELSVSTSSVNGAIKKHTLRSSPACTGFFDVQFQDKDANASFAVYDVRLPCSRTTAQTKDSVSLSYDFALAYDLVNNQMDATAEYLPGMTASSVTDFNSAGMAEGLQQDLTVSVAYGYCNDTNHIVQQDTTGASLVNCNESSWSDIDGSSEFTDAKSTDEWSHCAFSVVDKNDESSYIITTKIAMQYERVVKVIDGEVRSTTNFCADRMFTTTIRRDATASVSVATLRAPTLERAVTVTDIEWKNCETGSGYQLVISIDSQQKDIRHDDLADGELTDVLKATAATSIDSDGLQIEFNTSAADFSDFKLKSSCISITQSDCDERSEDEPQTDHSDSSESAYSQLTHTVTDLVLRGPFTGSDVDSDVRITTQYVQCPLSVENEASGFIRAAATLTCLQPIQNLPSPTVDSQQDCTQAYTTDKATTDVKLYISDNNDPTHKLTAAEHQTAIDNNWDIRHSKIFIERYEKNFDGSEGALITEDQICECGDKSIPKNDSVACEQTNDRVFGLATFDADDLQCGRTDGSAQKYDQLTFDFLPLIDATNDIFKVRFEILAENNDLDDVRQRLRAVRVRKELKATSEASAESQGLTIVAASYNTANEPTTTTTAAPADDEDEGLSAGAIVGIVAGALALIIIVALVVMRQQGVAASEEEVTNLIGAAAGGGEGAFRARRFSNLRY